MSTAEPRPPSGSDRGDERRASQRRQLRKLRWLALFALVAFLIFVAASFAAAYTERGSFCETASHEMGPYGRTWEKSAHKDVACVKCSVKPGALELVEAKGSALREVYVHFAGVDKAPNAVTEHIPSFDPE